MQALPLLIGMLLLTLPYFSHGYVGILFSIIDDSGTAVVVKLGLCREVTQGVGWGEGSAQLLPPPLSKRPEIKLLGC